MTRPGASDSRGFRTDIQGIRGLALVLVLLCHAELPFAEGGFVGLDVFYVLSGFLITGLVMRELERHGRVSLRRFYARRARRLLPLACFVLAVTLVAAVVLFQPVRQAETAGDVMSAALYFANWHFISQQVDYFALDEGTISPVQHYWSLSVEEQFYVLWPLLLLAGCALAAKRGRDPRKAALAVAGLVAAGSFAYSLHFSPADPQAAYFSTLTRAWELAAGGVLALVLPKALRLPRAGSALLAGGGLALLLIAGIAFSESDPYPSWRAALPALGTVAVIVAGTATASSLPTRLLAVAPLQYLGKVSYSWYLWHWPFVVFAIAIWGPLPPQWLVVVTLAAWIPAELGHRLVEEPFRRSRRLGARARRGLALGAAASACVAIAALAVSTGQHRLATAPEYEVAGAVAAERGDPLQERVVRIRPEPFHANEDRGEMWDRGCLIEGQKTASKECAFAHADSPRTVVLFGDSHALQYAPAMERIAERRDWRLVGLARGGCAVADVSYAPECDAWRENSLDRIVERERPGLVVLTTSTLDRMKVKVGGKRLDRDESQPYLVDGLARVIRRLKRAGAAVVLVRDQAKAPFVPHECVAEHPDRLRECAFEPERRDKLAFDVAAARRTGIRVIDPMPLLCRDGSCPSVIGDSLVYRDSYHLSATFSRTMADWLERRLPRPAGR